MIVISYRLINKTKEIHLAKAMTAYMGAAPADMSVTDNLCLTGYESVPYSTAICEVQRVVNLVCPLSKLECVGNSTLVDNLGCSRVVDFHIL